MSFQSVLHERFRCFRGFRECYRKFQRVSGSFQEVSEGPKGVLGGFKKRSRCPQGISVPFQ